jgi:hypothetical protein
MTKPLRAINPTDAKPSRPKIAIFGASGDGKTYGAIGFPNVYLIDCEGGSNLPHYTQRLRDSGGAYLGPAEGANDFPTVLEEIVSLSTNKHGYKTLVIDSYSKLFNTQVDATAEKMAKAGFDMSKTFGAEKKEAISYTRRMIRLLDRLDMNCVWVCHQKTLWKDGKEVGVTYDGWDKLIYELHLMLHVTKQGSSRKARVIKTRFTGFPDAEVFDWNYAAFAERYGKDIMEADAQAIELASADLKAQYQALLKVVRVEDKVLEKWADIEDADLDRVTVEKRIAWLTAQIPKSG